LITVEIDSEIFDEASKWEVNNTEMALAIVLKTWGSSPRQPGSMMLVREDGHLVGSVSGGCVEGAVIFGSKQIMKENKTELMEFGVADEDAWSVGLSCGGKISVFVCPRNRIEDGLFQKLCNVKNSRESAIIECNIENGSISIIKDKTLESENIFNIKITAKPRVLVVGAVHISQHLIPMAKGVGFDVVLIDPRSHFGTGERFPGVEVSNDWPDEALKKLKLSDKDCLVTLTHDPKIDDPALQIALGSPLFSICCLGSKKTHAARKNCLFNAMRKAPKCVLHSAGAQADRGSAQSV
jgi:xanthine dehydrogenase accessory factor